MDGKRNEFRFQGKRFWFLGAPAREQQNCSLDLDKAREGGGVEGNHKTHCLCPGQSPLNSPELLSSYQ